MGVVDLLWWSPLRQGLSLAREGFWHPFLEGQVGHLVWVYMSYLSVEFTSLVCGVT